MINIDLSEGKDKLAELDELKIEDIKVMTCGLFSANAEQMIAHWMVCCPRLGISFDGSNCGVEKWGPLCWCINKEQRCWSALVKCDAIDEYF